LVVVVVVAVVGVVVVVAAAAIEVVGPEPTLRNLILQTTR